ncbi:hypothetical protein [Parageobacillus thermoglucosidasius]|uniref:hypothetical protein n=1 Tax=Parageobacillus thermoglucosidasius TaxID=1426 RepID=UPI0001D170D3|nr:hypothetical protein [Parageobacillus thermoglucosidasius]AEH46784.1 hypothetical protein Geoth_0786 [Parageobacillus thermoglucosidasius C56-YS93]
MIVLPDWLALYATVAKNATEDEIKEVFRSDNLDVTIKKMFMKMVNDGRISVKEE